MSSTCSLEIEDYFTPTTVATVTITRIQEMLTVTFNQVGGEWKLDHAMDENGDEVALNANETLLAQCLVNAGVDETGR